MEKPTSNKKRILKTAIMALFVIFITAKRHGGINFLLIFPFLILSYIHISIVCYRNKNELTVGLTKVGIWFAALIIIVSSHVYMYKTTRATANLIAESLVLHQKFHGSYPASAEEAGISKKYMRKKRLHYRFESGRPFLMYPVTFLPFATYEYDFKSGKWVHPSS